ncbi:MAG: OmpA family protein, partial [Spirochaetales bacterium]|jgi:outer membrane protein OmpA-like peptidoglycan-associated protein|nr:OmpA family protein [Spirochaetales bacterium]
MRGLITLILLLTSFSALGATEFRFTYEKGEQFRILSRVDEEVYINGVFSHRADILNRISIEVVETKGDSGLIRARFLTSERTSGSQNVFEWAQEYESEFWRDSQGYYDIAPEYYMPVVRDVPVFPDKDLSPGDTWVAEGWEVHDFRVNFGITEAYRFPVQVGYEYLGKGELEGKIYDIILVRYAVFHQGFPVASSSGLHPIRIVGKSVQIIYWDHELGRPCFYKEEFDIIIELSSGDSVEYIGKAEAEVIESSRMNRLEIASEIQSAIEEKGVEDTQVNITEEGITLVLENIQFPPDSAWLPPVEQRKLEKIAQILKNYPGRDILIVGHTALAGTEEGRKTLSIERAKAVGEYLLSAGARQPEELIIQGVGATQPVAANTTEEGKRQNRRVEITILEN